MALNFAQTKFHIGKHSSLLSRDSSGLAVTRKLRLAGMRRPLPHQPIVQHREDCLRANDKAATGVAAFSIHLIHESSVQTPRLRSSAAGLRVVWAP
jgi:hypothetical protein